MIDSNDGWNRIAAVGHEFFSITFLRKNPKMAMGTDPITGRPKKIVIAEAGTPRHMLCRRKVKRYVKGVIPAGVRQAEDITNNILTVWDVQMFRQLRKDGKGLKAAGQGSYRRINMDQIVDISIPETVPA